MSAALAQVLIALAADTLTGSHPHHAPALLAAALDDITPTPTGGPR